MYCVRPITSDILYVGASDGVVPYLRIFIPSPGAYLIMHTWCWMRRPS